MAGPSPAPQAFPFKTSPAWGREDCTLTREKRPGPLAPSLSIAHVARALGISPTVVRKGVARGKAPLRCRGLPEASLLPDRWKQP